MAWPSAIPDDEWEEVAAGIPSKSEPFIAKFVSGREALIREEKKQRSDYAFRQSLSPLGKHADRIVSRIRAHEASTIWNSGLEDILAQKIGGNIYPGMMFSLAKERMEQTQLWKIIRKMPKGALLHAHMDAMVDFDYLFGVLLKTKGMHIYSEKSLDTEEAREGGPVKFRFQKVERVEEKSIWSSELFMRKMMKQLIEDGVKWIDLRLAFTFRYYKEGHDVPEDTFHEMFRVFGEEIENFKKTDEGKGFWGCRMIWTGLRILDTRKMVEDMDACIAIKIAYPHLISGFDLVGQEDAGRPLKDVLPELFWFKKQCAQEGVDIPFFFHAGETLGDGSDTDENLFDAVLLGTRRIGHGFSLYKHPLLVDMVKEKKILVETLLARGVPCSLCNDDPAILGQDTAGMTHDFWQALQGWENLGLAGLGSLAENSVRWAAFEDQSNADWVQGIKDATLGSGVRAQRMKEWSVEWEQFCLWIVSEFGTDADEVDEQK
ncbi:putative Adenosine deaminase CECR1-A [Glarea lozoyensis 74030]|uniref:adenosine deaminase n=1 Tax=Glarea lozoyensis (strain ATCC 74030 / MF5533) TaxID=1104152 RepID=H0ET43_GLAL7|nr:putative Adenosine deaminase CECR1-A [Glarea lozoyensis 74030]